MSVCVQVASNLMPGDATALQFVFKMSEHGLDRHNSREAYGTAEGEKLIWQLLAGTSLSFAFLDTTSRAWVRLCAQHAQ